MITLKTIGNFNKAVAWADEVPKQLEFSYSQGINDTIKEVRIALNKGTVGAFNKPVSFTQKAFLYKTSTKRNLIAYAYANDQKGKDRARYLRFGTKGGARPPKGFERYFQGVANDGTIKPGSYFVPTSFVKVNASGNVTLSTLKTISKGLKEKSYKPKGKKGTRGGFFIGTPRNNNLPPGIYRRNHEELHPYFIATTNKPDYTPRFDVQKIGDKIVKRRLLKNQQARLNYNVEQALISKGF
tara:strand:+ start:261 stop:983 length:723 start_codon:yes stop_codon:yes gene_type:complete